MNNKLNLMKFKMLIFSFSFDNKLSQWIWHIQYGLQYESSNSGFCDPEECIIDAIENGAILIQKK